MDVYKIKIYPTAKKDLQEIIDYSAVVAAPIVKIGIQKTRYTTLSIIKSATFVKNCMTGESGL